MEDERINEFLRWKSSTLEELIALQEASLIEFEAAKERLLNAKQSLNEARALTFEDYLKEKEK